MACKQRKPEIQGAEKQTALDINGYNATFDAFVKFAESAAAADKQKAVARFDADAAKELGRIVNRTIKPGSGDWVGIGAGRLASLKKANNITRDAFMKAVADMFGGESKIPDSVKDAMKLEDYGKGKPLTARRILAVKAAIDAEFGKFYSVDSEVVAKAKGWTDAELPKLARAAHLLSALTGQNELESIKQLSEPGSKPNRLMQYGGRFLDNAENFANGLRLMDSFATWFRDIIDTMGPVYRQKSEARDFSCANTPTKLNIDSGLLKPGLLKGIEKFVFEELASNSAHDLSGNDSEKLFGFENNAAMRFLGRGYGQSSLSTIANIPPAKRAVVFAAYDLFTKNATNAKEAHEQNLDGAEHRTQMAWDIGPTFLSRLLRNFDAVEAMHRKGTLTARNVLDKFFPDIVDKGNYDYKAVNAEKIDALRKLSVTTAGTIGKFHDAVQQYHRALTQVMEKTDITKMFDEVGGDELYGVKVLVGTLVLARCGEASLRGIDEALKSPVAGALQAVYDGIFNSFYSNTQTLPKHEQNVVEQMGKEFSNNMAEMCQNVSDALDVEMPRIPRFNEDLDDLDGDLVYQSVIDTTRQLHAQLVERERQATEVVGWGH